MIVRTFSAICSLLGDVCRPALEYLDALTFGQLLMFSLALRIAVQRLPSAETSSLSAACGALAMAAYFVLRTATDKDEGWSLLVSLLRSWFVFHLVASLATAALTIAAWAAQQFRRYRQMRLISKLTSVVVKFRHAIQRPAPRPTEPSVPAPPPLTRAERMQRLAYFARKEFDDEQSALENLPLDEDEREILLLQAKQRLLEKLSRLSEV